MVHYCWCGDICLLYVCIRDLLRCRMLCPLNAYMRQGCQLSCKQRAVFLKNLWNWLSKCKQQKTFSILGFAWCCQRRAGGGRINIKVNLKIFWEPSLIFHCFHFYERFNTCQAMTETTLPLVLPAVESVKQFEDSSERLRLMKIGEWRRLLSPWTPPCTLS